MVFFSSLFNPFFITYILILLSCSSLAKRNPVSTHTIDILDGRPAVNVTVGLYSMLNSIGSPSWQLIKELETDKGGRIEDFLTLTDPFSEGTYKMVFETKEYFQKKNQSTFYKTVEVSFEVENRSEHYHVPLLLSANGFSTYKGV